MFTALGFFLVYTCSDISSVSASSCQKTITCPCGSTNQNHTVCVTNIPSLEDVCKRWEHCEECKEDEIFCTKCPPGLSGPSCTEDDLKTLKENATEHPKRTGGCPRLKGPTLGFISCTTEGSHFGTCKGRCFPGYTFENRDREEEITLKCLQGNWSPLQGFPSCKARDSCKLQIRDAGFFNCTIGMKGTRCDVTCKNKYEGRYHCYTGKEWSPSLPYCVQPKGELDKEGSDAEQSRCKCENGGTCVLDICVCPDRFYGQFCENGELGRRDKGGEQSRCKCQNGGYCISNKCFCTDGFYGQYCENGQLSIRDNGGKQQCEKCENGGTCIFNKCFCIDGFYGQYCENDGLDRESKGGEQSRCKCKNGGTCSVSNMCDCPDGFYGQYCEEAVSFEVKCPDPGFPTGAERINSNGSMSSVKREFKKGEFVVFSCKNKDTALSGASFNICTASGKWSSPIPRCISVTS